MRPKHLFISGPPRSGTTMLQLILSSHSEITITPETRFIQKTVKKKYFPPKILGKPEINQIMAIMESDNKLNSWPFFNYKDYVEKFNLNKTSLNEFMDTVFMYYATTSKSGKRYLGNKKGLYADGYGNYFKKLYPGAKFIFIVRDPRDVTRSILQNLSKKKFVKAAFVCFSRGYFIKRLKIMYPQDVFVIKYEDLVTEPSEVISKICKYLKVDFEPAMLKFYEKNVDGSRLIGVTKDIHKNTMTPFNPKLINQWRHEKAFNRKQLQVIEAINYDYMQSYNYPMSCPVNILKLNLIALYCKIKIYYRMIMIKIAFNL